MSTKTPTRPITRLRVAHASMQFSDTGPQKRADASLLFDRAVERRYGWITGTEAGAGDRRDLERALTAQARAHGYRFYMDRSQDSWIAVRANLVAGRWTPYYGGKVIDGVKGQHTDKGVLSVGFDTTNLGRVNVMAAHYLTKGDPGAADPARHANVAANTRYARALGSYARRVGRGTGLVFLGADTNIVDRASDTLLREPLTSCWDELAYWPSTGHGCIDVIASYDRDGRVRCVDADAFPDSRVRLNTDHFLIEAVYAITQLRA